MALKKCRECKKEISDKADKCPHCGIKISRTNLGCAVALALMIIPSMVLSSLNKEKQPSPPKEVNSALLSELCINAQEHVKRHLKAPASAKFPDCVWNANEYEIRVSPDHEAAWVSGHVDSQNSYGALLRSEFIVKMEKTRSEWTLSNIEME